MKNKEIYECEDNDISMYTRANQTPESCQEIFLQKSDADKKLLRQLTTALSKNKSEYFFLIIEIGIYSGPSLIGKPNMVTIKLLNDNDLYDNHECSFNNCSSYKNVFKYRYLPNDARIAVNAWCVNFERQSFCLGSAATTIFNEQGCLKQGEIDLYLWPLTKFNQDITCYGINNMGSKDSKACITIEMPTFELPIVYYRKLDHLGDRRGEFYEYFTQVSDYESKGTNKFTTLKRILNEYNRDPFYNYNDQERFMIYKQRELLKNEPTYLPLFIKSIHWSFIEMMHESHKILKTWAPIDANTALGLLQNECSDKYVRRFAVSKIMKLSNRALSDFMPQLVQALKFESHHSSYLADELLKRALESPRVVGHAYFWALNASLYDKFSFERLYLHYERFLFLCSDYRKELYFQTKINDIVADTSSLSLRSPGMNKKQLAEILKNYINGEIKKVSIFDQT